MMGRYALDKPGLIYAFSGNQGFDPSQYKTFRADDDGIIPLLQTDWDVRDDATRRIVEFVGVAWPKEHLEENLKFIADSLGPNSGEQPRQTIRRYLATGFYKHHLSMYKKRPIYWLFSSGKQRAFQCLVYLHRYHEGTLARMSTEYVIPLQGQIAARIEQLEGDKATATSTSYRRKLQKEQDDLKKQQTELATFEEKLKHYADQKISLDLDDGVKVNYGKFGETFEAVRRAIDELAALVGYIVNNLNGHHLVVTADHGFLFTETFPDETDKSKLKAKPDGTILAKKRYLLGPMLPNHDMVWHGRLNVTAGVEGDMDFWIPRGPNLFHFVGGARFIHGGAIPQEIVVPVLTVKHVRGKSAQETKIKLVTVQVLGTNHRITTPQHRFQLIQMEPVSEWVKPITLKVAVYEGEEPVTDIQTVKFDSSSGNLDERKKWVNLVLKDRQYNKKTLTASSCGTPKLASSSRVWT